MSRTAKVIIGIVILLALFLLGKVIWGGKAQAPSTALMQNESPSQDSGLKTSGKDTSDDALNKDMASVDAEMNALSADSATADEAMKS